MSKTIEAPRSMPLGPNELSLLIPIIVGVPLERSAKPVSDPKEKAEPNIIIKLPRTSSCE